MKSERAREVTSYRCIDSPVGPLVIAAGVDGIKEIRFLRDSSFATPQGWIEANGRSEGTEIVDRAARQLSNYFAGKQREFQIPLAPRGTEFQQSVWRALQSIPYGQITSYGEIARQIGLPRASRAVGAANGANPIPIVIPCHRVIGASGTLTGYGGGLDIKEKLLLLEGIEVQTDHPTPASRIVSRQARLAI